MEEQELKVMQEKTKYFFDNSIPVHLNYIKKFWKRGYIKEIPASSDFFILTEFVDGDIPVFYSELYEIRKFREEELEEK